MSLDNLTPSQIVALSKATTKAQADNARTLLAPGQHIVPAFQVVISGNLTVSEDEDYIPTTSVSLIGATCLAIRRMGIQRGPFLKALKEVCQEALNQDEQTRSALMAEANVREFTQAFKEEFTDQLPKAHRQGKIRTNLTID